jgi:hypothetical protein
LTERPAFPAHETTPAIMVGNRSGVG